MACGHFHRAVSAFSTFSRRCNVVGIAGQAIACDFSVNLSAARFRVLIFFEDEHSSTFAHDKAIAAFIIRTRRAFWLIIIFGRHCFGRAEPGNRQFTNHRLRPACNHDICIAILNETRRIANRMGACRTCRHHRVVRAFKSMLDRDLARRQVDQS